MKDALFRCLGLWFLGVLAIPAQAATVTFNYDVVFSSGAVAPDGPSPYLTATFDDGGSAGSVTLTMTVAGTVNAADVDQIYFNFDPSLDLSQLSFAYGGGSTGPAAAGGGNNGIFVGTDAYQADGDGLFDIYLNFPPPPGQQTARWNAGETVIYTITSTQAITAQSFSFLSAPGGGAGGPFLSAAHFLDTGPYATDSAWVGAVPVPAALWLFGSGLICLARLARRNRTI
jgi:hypothetical protein